MLDGEVSHDRVARFLAERENGVLIFGATIQGKAWTETK